MAERPSSSTNSPHRGALLVGHTSLHIGFPSLFPFALSALGIGVIFAGVQYQRHRLPIERSLINLIPPSLRLSVDSCPENDMPSHDSLDPDSRDQGTSYFSDPARDTPKTKQGLPTRVRLKHNLSIYDRAGHHTGRIYSRGGIGTVLTGATEDPGVL